MSWGDEGMVILGGFNSALFEWDFDSYLGWVVESLSTGGSCGSRGE